ncbi:hypothetical protein OIV83_006039 [Microbotryomycetes sp. JL201]|nr:hypothetical protein OIV83_006039 [Microbotryomycetes sp. JL201]
MAAATDETAERVRQSLDAMQDGAVPSYAAQVLRRLSVSSSSATPPDALDQQASPAAQALLRATATDRPSAWYDSLWSTFGYARSSAEAPQSQPRLAIPTAWTRTDVNAEASDNREPTTERKFGDTVTEAHTQSSHVSDDARVFEIARRILYTAPRPPLVDENMPPLLVFVAANVPDHGTVSHGKLANALREHIEATAVNGVYNVLAVLNPNPNPPSWSQIVSLYWSTSRPSHKNVGKITIVGGGWWLSATLTFVVATLVSAKSASKIRQYDNLSCAAEELGQEQFKSADYDIEKTISLPKSWKQRKLFGASLEELMISDEPESLPRVVKDCLRVLREQGVHCSGIFRRPPSAKKVCIFQGLYEREQPVHLDDIDDGPFIAASLLRAFVGALPDAVFTDTIIQPVQSCPLPSSGAAASQAIRETIVPLLGSKERTLLRQMTSVLQEIAEHKQETLMDSSNLAICIMPSLLGQRAGTSIKALESCRVPSRGATGKATQNTLAGMLSTMIERHDEVFPQSL